MSYINCEDLLETEVLWSLHMAKKDKTKGRLNYGSCQWTFASRPPLWLTNHLTWRPLCQSLREAPPTQFIMPGEAQMHIHQTCPCLCSTLKCLVKLPVLMQMRESGQGTDRVGAPQRYSPPQKHSASLSTKHLAWLVCTSSWLILTVLFLTQVKRAVCDRVFSFRSTLNCCDYMFRALHMLIKFQKPLVK